MEGHEPITRFEQWYEGYGHDDRHDCLEFKNIAPCGAEMDRRYTAFKREMDARVANYDKLEKLADGEVISPKPDLPNISSGETAGLVRRTARNLVQNTPNVEIISKYDNSSLEGIFASHILKTRIIGSDSYSNDMQQNLFASTKTSLTIGFNCVIPALLQDAGGSWYIKYDSIHYRDVFPEPGVKDVRDATSVFVRRYLTKGEAKALIRTAPMGWDVEALKLMVKNPPRAREHQSVPHADKKHRGVPDGYEIITWYNDKGDPFLTYEARTKILLRIEKNKHPLKKHPVHFLVLEKDDQQPLGKSQVELLVGRQDFQDLMLNGAMKLWYRNINPSIIGYGTVNSIPNLSPGKYTQISNPNAKVEAFEVNTQTLLQYGTISQQNMGSMVNLLGTADQQMATQAGNGMSATPQGVEAQEKMVDITTNNYQKAIEGFFSHYCSYALTIYFAELKAYSGVTLTADARKALLEAGLDETKINEEGELDIQFEDLAVEYWVKCVPGSLTEMEDEKQLRILNQLFIPLSQAMPAMANAGDPQMIRQAAQAMQYIIGKQLELSGASSAPAIRKLWEGGDEASVDARDLRIAEVEKRLAGFEVDEEKELVTGAILQLSEQMSQMMEVQKTLLEKLGIQAAPSDSELNSSNGTGVTGVAIPPTVFPASA
jgi:hypothetical protein